MMFPLRDLGANVKAVHAGASVDGDDLPIVIVADDSEDDDTDNQERTGPTIDCDGFHSGVLVVEAKAALSAEETLSMRVRVQESDDDVTYGDPEELQELAVVATGDDSNEIATLEIPFDCASRKRYLQFLITADLSEVATEDEVPVPADDTAIYTAAAILGGARVLPVE
jgi:hypothetical protein